MAYVYLICSAGCSVLIAHLLKTVENKSLRTLPTLTLNYLAASVFAFVMDGKQAGDTPFFHRAFLLIICLLAGAFFICNFLMYSRSVYLNGMGVTIAAMRISLVIPIIFSIFFYQELIGWASVAGILIVLSSLVLLIPPKNYISWAGMDASRLLVLIFIVAGFADASLKIYQEEFSHQLNEMTFMGLVYAAAFFIGGMVMLLQKKQKFNLRECGYGCLIGLPNLYSSIFLIYALESISGARAYALVNILNVAAGTAIGVMCWKDQISIRQWIGLIGAVVAILLLVY